MIQVHRTITESSSAVLGFASRPRLTTLALAFGLAVSGCTTTSNDEVTTEETGPEYIYVANRAAGTISAFSLDASTGELAEVLGSPYLSASNVARLASDPDGRFLYALSDTDTDLYGYEIDPDTGELDELADSPFSVASGAADLMVEAGGDLLYIAHDTSPGAVSGYSIGADGALTELDSSPFSTAQNGTVAVVMHRSRDFLYTANTTAANFAGFSLNSTSGDLDLLANSPYSLTAPTPNSLTAEPAGRFLFAGDDSGAIYSFYVDTDTGDLGENSPSDTTVSGVVTVLAGPTGEYLYAAGGTGLHALLIRPSGALDELTTVTTSGADLQGLAVDSSGTFLYATDEAGDQVLAFSLATDPNAPEALDPASYATDLEPGGIVHVETEP
jgi:6-phosphogluconolactonase (cycloisomerase 2 family)